MHDGQWLLLALWTVSKKILYGAQQPTRDKAIHYPMCRRSSCNSDIKSYLWEHFYVTKEVSITQYTVKMHDGQWLLLALWTVSKKILYGAQQPTRDKAIHYPMALKTMSEMA